VVDGTISVSGSVGNTVTLELDVEAFKYGVSAGLQLGVPELAIDITARASTAGVCGTSKAGASVDFEVDVGAELDAFGGLGPASDLPNKFALFSTSAQIFSTCVAVTATSAKNNVESLATATAVAGKMANV
jgi:hypothetical protein